MEALGAQQRPPVAGHGGGGRDDRGVGQDAARGHVALAGDLVATLPHGPHQRQRAAAADPVDARRTTPGVDAGDRREAADALELLPGPIVLAGSTSSAASSSRSSSSSSTSRAAYSSQGSRQRTPRPVHRGVLLAQAVPEQRLHQRGQRHAGEAEQPAGELGVEERGRPQAQLGQAGQVLTGGVDDPLGAVDRLRQRRARRRSAPPRRATGSISTTPDPARRSWTQVGAWEYR